MRKKTFVLALTTMMATSVAAFGQSIPANTIFMNYDFTATDQFTAEVDATGAFTGVDINRGPFVDGPLAIPADDVAGTPAMTQVGFGGEPFNQQLTVDTTGGFAVEPTPSSTNFPLGNIFIGQPLVQVGDVVRMVSDLSFTQDLIDDPNNPGTLVESNSQFDNYFFGFRAGAGGGEFQPNDGISHSFRYNLGTDNLVDSDSNLQVFTNTNATSALAAAAGGDGNVALAPVSSIGIDIANGDFETDVFRIESDSVVTATDPNLGTTFETTVSVFDQDGVLLATTPGVTTSTDVGTFLANNRIQFAHRDATSGPGNPSGLTIHRLAVIFNPDASLVFPPPVESTMAIKGDVNLSGMVDFADIGPFIAVLQGGMFQAEADCDCSTIVDFADIPAFIAILQAQ